MRPTVKRYRLLKETSDGETVDVMGGPMGEDNVYVRTYGSVLKGEPAIASLQVGQSTRVRYSLSGTTGVYLLRRIEDGERPEVG